MPRLNDSNGYGNGINREYVKRSSKEIKTTFSIEISSIYLREKRTLQKTTEKLYDCVLFGVQGELKAESARAKQREAILIFVD